MPPLLHALRCAGGWTPGSTRGRGLKRLSVGALGCGCFQERIEHARAACGPAHAWRARTCSVCVCVCVCVYLQRRHVFAKERWGGRGCVPQSFTVRVLYIMYYICFYMYYICFYMLLLYMSACVRALARGLRFEVVKCLM